MSFPTQMEIAAGLIIVSLFIIAGLLYDAVMALNRVEDKLGTLIKSHHLFSNMHENRMDTGDF